MAKLRTNIFIQFIETAKDAKLIVNSDVSWKTKYGIIFSDQIKGRIDDTQIEFDWNDPDTTYRDDVLAYTKALIDKANELYGALAL